MLFLFLRRNPEGLPESSPFAFAFNLLKSLDMIMIGKSFECCNDRNVFYISMMRSGEWRNQGSCCG